MTLRRLVAAFLLLAFGAAGAATLVVTVTDRDGKPVPDAAVLLRYPLPPATKPAMAGPVVIEQSKLRFEPYLTVVQAGGTVLFTNRDAFDHHIVATPLALGTTAKTFETRLPPDPAKPYAMKFAEPGGHALSCHIHSRMRGYVMVSDTPWFAKTDAQGRATIDAPEGLADVQTWHPEQFADQAPQRVQLGASPATLASALNFTPRARRGSSN